MTDDNTPSNKDQSLKGVVGIQNMGNTCYNNTTIQLLRTSPEWNAYCLTHNFEEELKHIPDTNSPKRILVAYQDILRSLWSTYRPAYVRPLGFISEIRKAVKGTVYEMFGVPMPNDSHEFLVYLLDNFHEALKTKINYIEKSTEHVSDPIEIIRILAENGWNKYVSQNMSEIVNLFFGMMRKTIHCTNCQNNSYQWEVFNVLKVPCEGATFQEWIHNEVKETEIEGYDCEKCKNKCLAKIYSHIWKLPSNLFLSLRRFTYDGRKNLSQCPYDGTQLQFAELFAPESNEPSAHWSYELCGVSDHHGGHLGGHYTAQFKHPLSNEWWVIDDETANRLENPHISPSNYIFLFRHV